MDLFLVKISHFESKHTDTDTGMNILGRQSYEAVMKIANAGGIPKLSANKNMAYTYRYSDVSYIDTYWRHYNYSNNVVHIFLDSSRTLSKQMHEVDIKMDDENQNIGNMKGALHG